MLRQGDRVRACLPYFQGIYQMDLCAFGLHIYQNPSRYNFANNRQYQSHYSATSCYCFRISSSLPLLPVDRKKSISKIKRQYLVEMVRVFRLSETASNCCSCGLIILLPQRSLLTLNNDSSYPVPYNAVMEGWFQIPRHVKNHLFLGRGCIHHPLLHLQVPLRVYPLIWSGFLWFRRHNFNWFAPIPCQNYQIGLLRNEWGHQCGQPWNAWGRQCLCSKNRWLNSCESKKEQIRARLRVIATKLPGRDLRPKQEERIKEKKMKIALYFIQFILPHFYYLFR